MSTRSGKRIHGSFFENTLNGENEHTFKNDRKTKSKRQKENSASLEVTSSNNMKRSNYVTYPNDDDSGNVVEMSNIKDVETVRVLRKTTLKEQNWNVSNTTDDVNIVEHKKPTRQTRRTKKFVDNNVEDVPPSNVVEVTETEVIKTSKRKKNKKQRCSGETNENEVVVEISKKKPKKKKKKFNRETQLDVKNGVLDKSNMSVDSFHSAAGSPVNLDDNKANSKLDTCSQESTMIIDEHNLNSTKDTASTKKRRSSIRNNTVEKINASLNESVKNKRYSTRNSTFEMTTEVVSMLNTTVDKEDNSRKSNAKDATFDKTDTLTTESRKLNSTFEKTDCKTSRTPCDLNTTVEIDTNTRRKSVRLSSAVENVNTTFENDIHQSDVNTTFDKGSKLNSTFDKTETENKVITESKSSLISSDDNSNLTYDKSDNGSRISITSDDSKMENIINTTPLLIESSMDESVTASNALGKQERISEVKSFTPMKREGTFTKDGPEVSSANPKVSVSSDRTDRTPTKRMSLPSPGSTPFPFSKSSQKEKCMLNVTRSLEKAATRTSFSVEPVSRTTRVMFCSPVNNPAVVIQQKGKVIKSNLKGSNKSFIFDDSDTSIVRAAPRKRSYTHNDAEEARVKRSRLAGGQQHSVDRLSRPRTSGSTAKPTEPTTPSKKIPTPVKSKSDTKVSRTKLPNFAALHQRRFEKMESLDECQLRKAKRARQLLTPTAAITVLQRRSSPTGESTDSPTTKEAAPISKRTKKDDTPMKPKHQKTAIAKPRPPPPDTFKPTLPPLESLKPGYTRFGFKMNTENPFSIPSMTVAKPKENKPNGILTRQATLPSLAGTTSSRREVAKQTVMREKSFTLTQKRDANRNENRTVIKGVRTNRRFELQMKMRNIS